MKNKYPLIHYILFISCLGLLTSCVSTQELTYFQLKEGEEYQKSQEINNVINLTIQAGDELIINVSGLNPEVALTFNSNQSQVQREFVGYQVDKTGAIYIPVIGKVMVTGKTIPELNTILTEAIAEHINKPVVNIRFANLRVTVLGEVNRPGVIIASNEQISLLEAIGQAGDITDFGNRNNVLLIREYEGKRKKVYLDLLTNDIFTSPYYYLRQNDVIYVEPTKRKSTALSSQQTGQILGIITSITSVAALIIAIAK